MGSGNSRFKNYRKENQNPNKRRYVRYSPEEKESVIAIYRNSNISIRALARESGIPFNTLGQWTIGLKDRRARTKYSNEKRNLALKLCSRKGVTQKEVAQKLDIPLSTLKDWVADKTYGDINRSKNTPSKSLTEKESFDDLTSEICSEEHDDDISDLVVLSNEHAEFSKVTKLRSECQQFLQFTKENKIKKKRGRPKIYFDQEEKKKNRRKKWREKFSKKNSFRRFDDLKTQILAGLDDENQNNLVRPSSEIVIDEFGQKDYNDSSTTPQVYLEFCKDGTIIRKDKNYENEVIQEMTPQVISEVGDDNFNSELDLVNEIVNDQSNQAESNEETFTFAQLQSRYQPYSKDIIITEKDQSCENDLMELLTSQVLAELDNNSLNSSLGLSSNVDNDELTQWDFDFNFDDELLEESERQGESGSYENVCLGTQIDQIDETGMFPESDLSDLMNQWINEDGGITLSQ